MLKTAQLYQAAIIDRWHEKYYDDNYKWVCGSPGFSQFRFSEDTETAHDFASVDKTGIVIGVISYYTDWVTMSATDLVAINFERGNVIFAKDLYEVIVNIFEKFNLNRLCWSCIADNPAIRGYRHFIEKFGGRECGYFRQETRLQDGKMYDRVYFEILADDYFKAKKKRKE